MICLIGLGTWWVNGEMKSREAQKQQQLTAQEVKPLDPKYSDGPNSQYQKRLLAGKLPPWGFVRCWHPYGTLDTDDFYCAVGKDESLGYPDPIVAVTKMTKMLEQSWKVKDIINKPLTSGGLPKVEFYMNKAKR